jgi:putative N-acetylmannosamine-6-phosphate epimerase
MVWFTQALDEMPLNDAALVPNAAVPDERNGGEAIRKKHALNVVV